MGKPSLQCPTCTRPIGGLTTKDAPHFPFCSHRCRLQDLGAWLDENYRIPQEVGKEEDVEDETESLLDRYPVLVTFLA